jgi:hypothetical protein
MGLYIYVSNASKFLKPMCIVEEIRIILGDIVNKLGAAIYSGDGFPIPQLR